MARADVMLRVGLMVAALATVGPTAAHAQPANRSPAEAASHTDLGRWRVFPSLRVGAGPGFSPSVGEPVGITHDLTVGVRVFRAGGVLFGVDVGYSVWRRTTHPGANEAILGAPLGWVSRRNRVQLGGRLDLLAGRWDGLPTYGLRTSAFAGIRHSLFLEGGFEQRWDDGISHRGGRVTLVVDLGVLVSSSTFLRAALH